nr:hypothetical protein [Xylella fastidiosa]
MKDFGEHPEDGGFNIKEYNGLTNSCIDFTWKALEIAGLNPNGFEGHLWPTFNIHDVKNINNTYFPFHIDYRSFLHDSTGSNSHGTEAAGGPGAGGASVSKRITPLPPRDPLALDLDGDGIETTSSDGRVILFDHDADGVKTGTGWLKPDDGWLVLDRKGNGTIDSGRELFGTDTLKRNGQLATDGFDALRDVDSNQDGKIDAADRVFANLRIWRDLNQDGITQANELSTLDANHIVSIGVTATAGRVDLGNGNVQTAAGTFTRSNGTTGATEGTLAPPRIWICWLTRSTEISRNRLR